MVFMAPIYACPSRKPDGIRPVARSLASACPSTPAGGMQHQGMVQIFGLGQAQQDLQQPLHRGRGSEVGAAHDQVDAARRVVDDAGEVIGRGRVLAGEDRIADVAGLCREARAVMLGPAWQPRLRQRFRRVQPPAVRCRCLPLGVVGQAAAGAGIGAAGIAVRGGQRLGDVGPGAEAGIDQAHAAQPLQRFGVKLRPCRLHQHLAVPGDPQPAHILENAVDELGPAAAGVEVLDPQPKAIPGLPAKRRRIGMAQMQPPRRRRREAGGGQIILPSICWGGGPPKAVEGIL
jgi:hypothetical protein